MCQNSELVALYEQEKTAIAARKQKAIYSARNLATHCHWVDRRGWIRTTLT
jgi:hypothetical protein